MLVNRAAPTQYVGMAGLGVVADEPEPSFRRPLPCPGPDASRYDSPTPFDAITDGLSQSLLIGERAL